MAPPASNLPLPQRMLALAQTLQFAWFIGHFILIVSTARFVLAWVMFKGASAYIAYRLIFVSAAATYGIVVYKTVRARTKQRAQISPIALAADENVQYLLMALVWLFCPRYLLATLPYAIYSFFHVATYTRANLIPTIFPPKAAAGAESDAKPQTVPHPLAEAIGKFVKEYYDSSMSVVASLEIALWGALFFSAILFQRRSWILLPLYTAFLRARYSQSQHVQNSFAAFSAQVDNVAANQGVPPAARQAWAVIKTTAGQFRQFTDISQYMGPPPAAKKTS